MLRLRTAVEGVHVTPLEFYSPSFPSYNNFALASAFGVFGSREVLHKIMTTKRIVCNNRLTMNMNHTFYQIMSHQN